MEGEAATVTVLEHCKVSPAPDGVPVTSLHLPFFDLLWLTFHPLGRLILYDFPHSTNHFIQKTVPILKTSLSLALKNFTPLAGKLLIPSDADSNADCLIRYSDGDSVSVTFAECNGDVNHFFGGHARDADVLKPLATPISSTSLFAIQVTVFPNRAISIGIMNSHVVADGNTVFNFIRAWASIAKRLCSSDIVSTEDYMIPDYDRSSIKDPYGLGTMIMKSLGPLIKQVQIKESSVPRARATFVLTESKIQALKKTVLAKRPELSYVSSFTVTCAYLWTCFAKSRYNVEKEKHRLDEPQNFGFVMDCRARLDPPLPNSYFGNCLVPCIAAQTGRVMAGDEGLEAAAEVLGNAIAVKLKEGPLHDSEKWMEQFAGLMRGEWSIGIAGSPKLDYYNNIDFGWGKPLKFEFVNETLSLSRCKDSKMDIEIGVILPEAEMDEFSTLFIQGLRDLDG
ncbi:hypothetical protein DCAR_0208724 [Daucus carota subsp. sativus]|uniref:Uncharacterized protein n=1 Tax=Daucus carota subsp. sativus TaxID=79200 RepID=A0A166ERN7_DAUCS|nr:PREDICTED: malonyl-coenzyme A:anthocyanin 3-O-glucoside-6''-O-malonyltransferase-like [Daucus carota subsp. sativus]WOG89486.1 hypothetical protein DCAR_0208724 [Daucus carota subsp. sativus]